MTDREIDSLVAEKVCGWPPRPRRADLWWYSTHHCGESGFNPTMGDTCPKCDGIPPEIKADLEIETKYLACPRYSTDIAAAWEVVEKVSTGYRNFRLDYSYVLLGAREWFVVITDESGTTEPPATVASANAPTAPLAICRAALRAVGVEI